MADSELLLGEGPYTLSVVLHFQRQAVSVRKEGDVQVIMQQSTQEKMAGVVVVGLEEEERITIL